MNWKKLIKASGLDTLCEVLGIEKDAPCHPPKVLTERQQGTVGTVSCLQNTTNGVGSQEEYAKRLRERAATITDLVERNVFDYILFAYERSICSDNSKNVSKQMLVTWLKGCGLMNTNDDRTVRRAVRDLLKRGFPVGATSKEKGYFIIDNWCEWRVAEGENKSRIKRLFEAEKGFREVARLLSGQIDMWGDTNEQK